MERVFDDLLYTIQPRLKRRQRGTIATWSLHLAGNLTTGIAIGIGISVGMALAG
ncbi:hypothetical protein [Mesorhizobium sp. M4B.F.Ca.ET.013.02.1.1]|uniref:hypothetical protein n=1 Tax=Mesorhizobium sp. M4B.F.Ca.ET.013.02.1.1 TaxID=2496755 RepID=UPI001671AA24|nr:hypothetical protein [Mesorhizobium sp. M4B.F.Ca.ET.013.02.1.1]